MQRWASDAYMKWAADPSCYKTAASSRNKSSTRRIKYLAPVSSCSCPGMGCGTAGVEADRVGAVLSRGGGGGEARKALTDAGDCTRGARPTVRKHGMDMPQNPAPGRSQPGCSIRSATSFGGCASASGPSRDTSSIGFFHWASTSPRHSGVTLSHCRSSGAIFTSRTRSARRTATCSSGFCALVPRFGRRVRAMAATMATRRITAAISKG